MKTKKNINKKVLWVLAMGIVTIPAVFAVAPAGGYAPAATLDPACAPWDTDCFVTMPISDSTPDSWKWIEQRYILLEMLR